MSFANSLENLSVAPKVSASEAIPPIAQPFISDKARKMIDLVRPTSPLPNSLSIQFV